MVEKKERKEALEEAIRFEIDGREFFLKAAQEAKNYFAKLIFETIAEEELGHIQRVREIYDRPTAPEKQIPPSQILKKGSLENIFQEAKRHVGEKIITDANELEAIRLAVQLEIKGHEFYKRLAEEAPSEFEKAFYLQLAQEESHHFSILHQVEETVMKSSSFG